MDCSVIISACNEYPKVVFTIQSCIENLRDKYEYEILIINNKSNDKTKRYFTENKNPKVKYFEFNEKNSHWLAKNKGIEKATGKYLFFIDAHCLLQEGSIPKLIEFAEKMEKENKLLGGVHCIHSPMLFERKFEHYTQAKFMYRFRVAQKNKTQPYEVFHMSTCGMLTPKKVVDELGGWNKNFGLRWGGEAYFNLKQATCGYPQFIHPEARYFHFKGEYKYSFKYSDGVKNNLIASYCIGGREWLNKMVEDYIQKKKKNKSRPNNFTILGDNVEKICKTDREFIKSKQIISLTDYFKKWDCK